MFDWTQLSDLNDLKDLKDLTYAQRSTNNWSCLLLAVPCLVWRTRFVCILWYDGQQFLAVQPSYCHHNKAFPPYNKVKWCLLPRGNICSARSAARLSPPSLQSGPLPTNLVNTNLLLLSQFYIFDHCTRLVAILLKLRCYFVLSYVMIHNM